MQQDYAELERSFKELADRESQLQQQLQMVREQVHAGPREVSLLPQACDHSPRMPHVIICTSRCPH